MPCRYAATKRSTLSCVVRQRFVIFNPCILNSGSLLPSVTSLRQRRDVTRGATDRKVKPIIIDAKNGRGNFTIRKVAVDKASLVVTKAATMNLFCQQRNRGITPARCPSWVKPDHFFLPAQRVAFIGVSLQRPRGAPAGASTRRAWRRFLTFQSVTLNS